MTGPTNNPTGSSENAVAFRKAADYCAIQERCISEVQQKLRLWEVDKASADEIIKRLLEEGFINEHRYATSFARGKFRILHWGRIKIKIELIRKFVARDHISIALQEIDESDYLKCLQTLLEKKIITLGGDTPENRFKAMRFAAGKGFEPELIQQIINLK
jgi:regulatory protein